MTPTRFRGPALFLLFLLIAGAPVEGRAAEPPPTRTRPAVVITEIGILPEAQSYRDRWIELQNRGARPVNLSGWCIRDKDGNKCILPDNLRPLSPNGRLLLVLGRQADRYENVRAIRLTGRAAERLCGNGSAANECAVFPSARCRPKSIVDYICWGDPSRWRETETERAAITAGLWRKRKLVEKLGLPPPEELFIPREEECAPGQSLARVHRSDGRWSEWIVVPAEDISPGKRNRWPAPVAFYPTGKIEIDPGGKMSFRWAYGTRDPAWWNRIQIALDRNMKRIVVDEKVGSGLYALRPGVYYWRVRSETNGDATRWSPTQSLTLLLPGGKAPAPGTGGLVGASVAPPRNESPSPSAPLHETARHVPASEKPKATSSSSGAPAVSANPIAPDSPASGSRWPLALGTALAGLLLGLALAALIFRRRRA